MKTIVYLVRHGEVHNPNKIIYGRLPGYHLSDRGKQQATHLGNHLKKKKIHAVYASPLTRAQETASYVVKHFPSLALSTEERIIEVLSPVDGQPNSTMFARDWNFYTPDLIGAGGEDLATIWSRMEHFLQEVAKNHPGKQVVAVSHGDPVMIVRAKSQGKNLTVESIRGPEYIHHANGIAIAVENGVVSYVEDIHPEGIEMTR